MRNDTIQITGRTISEIEHKCSILFQEAGPCWHLYTSENHEIVFTNEQDFKAGMSIIAISAQLHPELKIYTYSLMSNHLHVTVAGKKDIVESFMGTVNNAIKRYLVSVGRSSNFPDLELSLRQIKDVSDMRNVIVYNNRNGYLISPADTPFSYRWGAGSFYFNPYAKQLGDTACRKMLFSERRACFRSHIADCLELLPVLDGYICPTSFCAIAEGEAYFRDGHQYFYLLSKSMESQREIAAEIGESIFYTDDELFSAVRSIAIKNYGSISISTLPPEAKIELAKTMKFQYRSSNKAICRILKLNAATVDSLFPKLG